MTISQHDLISPLRLPFPFPPSSGYPFPLPPALLTPPALTAGWTPLMYASYVGHDTVVNLLLESGADPSKGTDFGLTPLMVAAGCGNESVCYFLLQVTLMVFTEP